MRSQTHRVIPLLIAAALAAAASIAGAQNAAPPARETPRPQDIDPAVNTSATPPASERDAPSPEDINPAVDTSAQAPAPSAASQGNTQGGSQAQPGTPPADAQAARPASRGGRAQDRIELDTTQITGNRELPKVLYIVPWKRSDLGDLVGKPVNSLLDEVLTPVDRDVFKRENRYYRALTPGAAENDALSANDVKRPMAVRETPASAPPGAGSPGSATSDLPRPMPGSVTPAPARDPGGRQ